jgi:hypothetical protein
MTPDETVDDARRMTRRIVLFQAGKCGGKIEQAMGQVSDLCGVGFGSLKMLWSRSKELKSVDGRILKRLEQFDAYIDALESRERDLIAETAEDLAARNHPAAWVARKMLEMADEAGS